MGFKGSVEAIATHNQAKQLLPGGGSEWLPVLIVFAAALLFASTKRCYYYLYDLSPNYVFAAFLLSALASLFFWRERYEGLSPAFNILLKGIALSVGFYALTASPSFDIDTHAEMSSTIIALEASRLLAIACAVLAIFRPSFTLVVCVYVLLSKDISKAVLDLPTLSRTDYMPVVELGIYLTLCVMIFEVLNRLQTKWQLSYWHAQPLEDRSARHRLSLVAFFVAVSVHFGNYFYSARAKYLLDGGPLDWVLENNTALLMLVTQETWALPIGHWPELSLRLYDSFSAVYVLSNLVILLAQTVCIVAIWRVGWAMWLTVFYDITHIVIFFVTGIFFWKWIFLNLFIVLAFRSIRSFVIPNWLKLLSSFFVVGGASVFFVAKLGWYDTNALANHYFLAETENGDRARVPSNYFLTGSVTAAQQRLGSLTSDQFPVETWATTRKSSVREKAERDCDFGPGHVEPRYKGDIDSLSEYVRKHHRYILTHLDDNGRIWYDAYPHHIFSNPLMSREFYALDKRKIEKYIYVVESVCLGSDRGRLMRDTRTRHEFEIRIVGQ